ncbi:MAG: hypothetical protein K2G21_11165 [Muribaculaceae bacterium]|nr:hypothetical protein [Muribaculaceae bacterium]
MNEDVKKEQKLVCCSYKKWRGYSIDELEQRRAINAVKCDLIKEQLSYAYKGMVSSFSLTGNNSILGMKSDQIMAYMAYGVQFFKYTKNLVALYRNIKSTFKPSNDT